MKLHLNNSVKGYLFIFVSIIAMSNVYIFSKAALNTIHLSQFGVYWFSFALFFILIFNRKRINLRILKALSSSCYMTLLLIGIFELIGTTLFFMSINSMSNPALVSFMGNSTPVFVTILGLFVLRERFNLIEFLGVFTTIVGSFIIAYNPGLEVPKHFYTSIIFIVLSSVVYALSTIIAKRKIKKIPTAILTLNRTLFLLTASVIFLIVTNKPLIIPVKAVINTLLGAFLGPFLAAFASYSALKYIEASKASVLSSAKGVFVLITAWIYFSKLPSDIQIFGGLLTIAGIILISTGKLILNKKTPDNTR